MPRRRLAKPGLSYLDANKNRLVTIDDDVLGVKREIEDRWPFLEVFIDKDGDPRTGNPTFLVIEHCADGVDRLALERPFLDQRLVTAIEDADQYRRDAVDPIDFVDAWDARIEKEQERKFTEKMGDATERLIHAMKKDGLIVKPKVFISSSPLAK